MYGLAKAFNGYGATAKKEGDTLTVRVKNDTHIDTCERIMATHYKGTAKFARDGENAVIEFNMAKLRACPLHGFAAQLDKASAKIKNAADWKKLKIIPGIK